MTAGEPRIARHRLFQAFFFAAFGLVAWQLHRILSEFYVALLGAVLLGLIVYPVHTRLSRLVGGRPTAAAALTTSLVVLVVVLPALGGGWVAVRQTTKLVPVASEWLHARGLEHLLPTREGLPPWLRQLWEQAEPVLRLTNIDPREAFIAGVEELAGSIRTLAASALKNILFFAFQLSVLVVSLFFLLRDGPRAFKKGLELVPLPDEHKRALIDRMETTLLAVVRGIFVVAALQGLLSALGFWLLDVPFAVLLGALVAFLAPVPLVGSAAVWVPVAAGLALSGAYAAGLGVALWCGLVVFLSDNVLRPILIGAEAKLPFLLLFFGMLGGLKVYGFAGILVGPVFMALFLAFADIYRREYRWLLAAREET